MVQIIPQEYKAPIAEYNDILLGIKKRFSKDVVLTAKSARAIGRFAFAYYMEWGPYEIRDRITLDVLQKLKLDKIFERFADFPHELNAKKDLYYYAHWLYPELIKYDVRSAVLRVYTDVLDGKRSFFSMNFFNDDYAMERSEICLQEALKRTEFKNEYEMYALFASDEVYEFLEKYKLMKPLQMYYKTPVNFLHEALPEGNKSDFWYNYFLFVPQYKKRLDAAAG